MTILSRGQHGNDELFFDKTWDEMEEPFGTPGQEFWFGLKNLFELTFNGDYELKVKYNMYSIDHLEVSGLVLGSVLH